MCPGRFRLSWHDAVRLPASPRRQGLPCDDGGASYGCFRSPGRLMTRLSRRVCAGFHGSGGLVLLAGRGEALVARVRESAKPVQGIGFVDHCPKTSPPPRRVLGELVLKRACGGGSSFASPVWQPTAGADPQAVNGSSRTPGSGHQDVGPSCWTPFEDVLRTAAYRRPLAVRVALCETALPET